MIREAVVQKDLEANLLDTLGAALLEGPPVDSPLGPARELPPDVVPGTLARRVDPASWGRTPDAVAGQRATAEVLPPADAEALP